MKKKFSKEKERKGKKAQLLGSEILLWFYRFWLIALVAIGTLIIVGKYQSITLDKNPFIASKLVAEVINCEGDDRLDCLSIGPEDDIYVSYDGKAKGNENYRLYCELIKQGREVTHLDLYCKEYKIFDKTLYLAVARKK
ncbi:MAG: hypothetical protein QW199_02115 [Candidatus Pacearchaeota archaeon]